ncbi:hypothetical protein LO762_27270 [Actinocorallia sp. API 0066]|uniref:hypothetical protein n=1 Tax=Actinocorallia sp. API 0066 TaxID=2896846 RepID=UPI001E5937E2|nr:hypothetical protein [Actinocorallia sp. API 0066]MCD0452854.1 hypothetical protein [Actinocorallia sp. API 0066]
MTVEEIRRALYEARGLDGRQRLERMERLAEHARACPDRVLEVEVLSALVTAHEYSAERARLPVVIGRLLRLLDEHPAEVGGWSHQIHWSLKWMTSSMIKNPAVPLTTIERWMDEMERRYRERGNSPRPVHSLRASLAFEIGDLVAGAAHTEATLAAERDELADCAACEANSNGHRRVLAGDDVGALLLWEPVLDGRETCAHEPHVTLADALLPLLRTGAAAEARSAHLKGYPLVRGNEPLRAEVGQHVEFCALTGNEARGLEIVAEHVAWLTDTGEDAHERYGFLVGVAVLLRRLSELGMDEVAVGAAGTGTVASLRAAIEPQLAALAARYDARNGTDRWSASLAVRLARRPLLAALPLGAGGALPEPVAGAVPEPVGEPGADGAAALWARARHASALRDPRADVLWARAVELPAPTPEAALEARLYAARGADGEDPEKAAEALTQLFPDLVGHPALRVEALASLAILRLRTGATDEGAALAVEAAETSDELWEADGLDAVAYLSARRAVPFLRFVVLQGEEDEAAIQDAIALFEAEAALAASLDVPARIGQYAELAGRFRMTLGDAEEGTRLIADAHARFLETGQHWLLPGPAHLLAVRALEAGDHAEAERLVREALRLGPPVLGRADLAPLASFLVEILADQRGRELDVVDTALEAARLWADVHEPDHLHMVFTAARAYLGRHAHGEAAALFEQVIDRVETPYDPPAVAMTHRQYGDALRGTGDHRGAAEQYLAAAARAAGLDDAVPMEAELAWLAGEELEHCGRATEALAAYRRAAALWTRVGAIEPETACRRAAAWVEYCLDESDDPGAPDATGPAQMKAILAELEERAAGTVDPEVRTSLDGLIEGTRDQLGSMLTDP